jgi:hypothetical protein
LTLPLFVTTPVAVGDTVTIAPCRDNTLIESLDGSMSNAGGTRTTCGRNNSGGKRRAVTAFNVVAAVPAGSTITDVSLRFTLFQASGMSGDEPHTLHRLDADWGEGTSAFEGGMGAPSTPGDATWMHTFYDDEFWAVPGGDYDAAASGAAIVGVIPLEEIVFSSPEMATDVQAWLEDPASNFGWIMVGNEAVAGTTKQFLSREASDETMRPQLTIEFDPPMGVCASDTDDSGEVDVEDIIQVILAWGCDAGCDTCDGDTNGDATTDAEDLMNVIANWGPCQ